MFLRRAPADKCGNILSSLLAIDAGVPRRGYSHGICGEGIVKPECLGHALLRIFKEPNYLPLRHSRLPQKVEPASSNATPNTLVAHDKAPPTNPTFHLLAINLPLL